MILCEPIVEALAPKDYETPQFYMEEWVQISNAAHEMFILIEDLQLDLSSEALNNDDFKEGLLKN